MGTVAVVTDTWEPHVNGVVRTMSHTVREMRAQGHTVEVVGPDRFRTVPCPTYPELRLALRPGREVARALDAIRPASLHIVTEGPLGWAARRWAVRRRAGFTTGLHTRFPEYVRARTRLPAALGWAVLRRFHAPSAATLVATEGLRRELDGRGFGHLCLWSRGVDTGLFRPDGSRSTNDAPGEDAFRDLPRPIFLCVGRVAVEKNIPAFLSLDLPGTKVVVGDGPALPRLRARFPGAVFTGALHGAALARAYAAADAFVFPSRTDTFGLVMLESMSCGTPVAAFPVPGPRDVVTAETGVLDEDLRAAALAALRLDRGACRAHAERLSWRACADRFLQCLVPVGPLAG